MPKPSPLDRGGRYDLREINLRVERMRVTCRVLAKEVAGEVGLTESAWSKKMNLNGSSFTIAEYGKIADYFTGKTGRRLIGFPFVDPTVSDLLEHTRRH